MAALDSRSRSNTLASAPTLPVRTTDLPPSISTPVSQTHPDDKMYVMRGLARRRPPNLSHCLSAFIRRLRALLQPPLAPTWTLETRPRRMPQTRLRPLRICKSWTWAHFCSAVSFKPCTSSLKLLCPQLANAHWLCTVSTETHSLFFGGI